jgi:hypothetical protein
MEGLALTLLDMIDAQGAVFEDYGDAREEPLVDEEPLYFPGETMLALIRLHERTGDPRWLEGARRIGDRQCDLYEENASSLPDHWVMQALGPLWQATRDERYAETAWAMATHTSAEQIPNTYALFPDYFGSWHRRTDVPRTTRAASRLEALRGVVHLAWAREKDARAWEDSMLLGARHLVVEQYRAENMWWVARPERVLGAYPLGVVDNHVRIDNNQHALVGMIGAVEVIRHRSD